MEKEQQTTTGQNGEQTMYNIEAKAQQCADCLHC